MANLPLSPLKQVGNLYFLSGQVGQQEGKLVSDDIAAQIEQAIRNVEGVLKQNAMTLHHVIDVTAFLVEQDDYAQFNEVYARNFEEPYPTRTSVTVKSLPLGARVELKVVASKS